MGSKKAKVVQLPQAQNTTQQSTQNTETTQEKQIKNYNFVGPDYSVMFDPSLGADGGYRYVENADIAALRNTATSGMASELAKLGASKDNVDFSGAESTQFRDALNAITDTASRDAIAQMNDQIAGNRLGGSGFSAQLQGYLANKIARQKASNAVSGYNMAQTANQNSISNILARLAAYQGQGQDVSAEAYNAMGANNATITGSGSSTGDSTSNMTGYTSTLYQPQSIWGSVYSSSIPLLSKL